MIALWCTNNGRNAQNMLLVCSHPKSFILESWVHFATYFHSGAESWTRNGNFCLKFLRPALNNNMMFCCGSTCVFVTSWAADALIKSSLSPCLPPIKMLSKSFDLRSITSFASHWCMSSTKTYRWQVLYAAELFPMCWNELDDVFGNTTHRSCAWSGCEVLYCTLESFKILNCALIY